MVMEMKMEKERVAAVNFFKKYEVQKKKKNYIKKNVDIVVGWHEFEYV